MPYNSKFSSQQVEAAIEKSIADLELEGATVNIDMVDENTPASGSVTKEEGSDRARFDFKIPVPKLPAPAKWVKFTPADSRLSLEADDLYYKIKEDCIYFINKSGGGIFVQNNGGGFYNLISCSDLGLTYQEASQCSMVRTKDGTELVFYNGFFCLYIHTGIDEVSGFYSTAVMLK